MGLSKIDHEATNEELAMQLRRITPHLAVMRAATRKLAEQCECRGTGKRRKPSGFFTVEVECVKCLPLRDALATGEII